MQSVIYAGLRNPGRDQAIHDAALSRSVKEVAAEMRCAPSTVRAAVRRISDLDVFSLTLVGGVKTSPSGGWPPKTSGARPLAPTATSPAPSGI